MSSSSSSSSFHLFSATTLSSITKPFSPTSIHIFPSLITPHLNLSTTPTSINLFKQPTSSPQLARHFAIAASFKLDEGLSSEIEEEEEEEEEETPNYSPDLKIYVGNLPWNVDSAELAGLFQRAGNVEMVEVVYDKGSGRSRGFGFVTMSSVKEVEAATRQFNGYALDGRQLRVNAGPPPSKGESFFRGQRDGSRGDDGGRGGVGVKDFDNTNKVYVGNLAWSVDNLALETLFQDQGNVMEARVIYDRDSGRSKGFGFVTYGSMDEVNKAIDSLDGVNVDGRNIRVSVAEARQRPQF